MYRKLASVLCSGLMTLGVGKFAVASNPVDAGTLYPMYAQSHGEDPSTTVRSGDRIYILDKQANSSGGSAYEQHVCTLGPVLSDEVATTAGHCGSVGDEVFGVGAHGHIGTIVAIVPGTDIAVVGLNSRATGVVDEIAPLPEPGSQVTKRGATSGNTAGVLYEKNNPDVPTAEFFKGHALGLPDSVARDLDVKQRLESLVNGPKAMLVLCVRMGDSGGPVFDDQGRAIGVISASPTYYGACSGGQNAATINALEVG